VEREEQNANNGAKEEGRKREDQNANNGLKRREKGGRGRNKVPIMGLMRRKKGGRERGTNRQRGRGGKETKRKKIVP
jgi:hypothetical protein